MNLPDHSHESIKSELFNITVTVHRVMQCIAAGVWHRRDIEDRLKISEKHALRAIDKLKSAGMIQVVPARDPGKGGRNVRLYRCLPTETGFLMLELVKQINKHRK